MHGHTRKTCRRIQRRGIRSCHELVRCRRPENKNLSASPKSLTDIQKICDDMGRMRSSGFRSVAMARADDDNADNAPQPCHTAETPLTETCKPKTPTYNEHPAHIAEAARRITKHLRRS